MTIAILAALAMIVALGCGLRWPGVLLAGCMFSYQASSLAGIGWLGEAYALAAAVIAITRATQKGAKIAPHALDGALFLLVLWAGLSTIYAPYPDQAFFYFLRLVMSVGSMYAVARLASRENPNGLMTQFLFGLVAIGGFLAFLLASVDRMGMYRLKLEDTAEVGLAHPLPYVAVGAALLFLTHRLWAQALAAAAMGAVFYTSVLSGTRSVFLSAGVALVVVLLVIVRRQPIRTMGMFGIAVVVAVIIGPLFFSEQIEPMLERLTMNFANGGVDLTDASSQERRFAFYNAIDMFYESPILGKGHGSFSQLTVFSYPHNIFLEAACELGVIGFTLLIVWLAILAKGLLRTNDLYPTAGLVLLAVGVVSIVQMQVSYTLFMARPLFLLTALVAAFAPVTLRRRRKQRRPVYA